MPQMVYIFDYLKIESRFLKNLFCQLGMCHDSVVPILIPFREVHNFLHSLEQEQSMEGGIQS